MSDLRVVNPIVVEDELKRMELWKLNADEAPQYFAELMSNVYGGRVKMMHPSNPVAFALSSMALANAFTIQEHVLMLRKTFAKLANNEEDLYRHMSNEDYKDVFSKPAKASVSFNVHINDFMSRAYVDPESKDKIVVIPRYSSIRVGDYNFTTFSPVMIRVTESGIVDVRYLNNLTDDLFPLTTDYIPFETISLNQQENYINFNLDLPEIMVTSNEMMIQKGKNNRNSFSFDAKRQFYFAKAWYQDSVTSEWVEMNTTHTEDIWDIKVPTCVFKLDRLNSSLNCYVPPTYVNNGTIGGKIKIVIYTTMGPMNVNFSDFKLNDFSLNYLKIFPSLETGPMVDPLSTIAVRNYIQGKVVGGRDGVDFDTLKEIVINNSLVPNIPITDNQLDYNLKDQDLVPVKDYDVVTGRSYLIKSKIPSSVSKYEIARAQLDLIEFKTSFDELRNNKNSVVEIDKHILVLPSGTLFDVSATNGVSIVSKDKYKAIKDLSGQKLAVEVNTNNYMSLYYNYVFDDVDGFVELRPYEVNYPKVLSSNFKDYNRSTLVSINSRSVVVSKTKEGYRIDVLVEHKTFNELYNIADVLPVLVYESSSGFRYYLEGKLYADTEQGKIVSFYIESDSYIDRYNMLHVNNFKDVTGRVLRTYFNIEQDLNIIYCTPKVPPKYKASSIDEMLYGSYLSGKVVGITREVHRIEFAKYMKYLYRRVHTSTGKDLYKTHEKDVYETYQDTVFNNKNEIIHRPGDFVLDDKGKKIVKWEKGTVCLDDDGNPVPIAKEDLARFLNLLLIDYKFSLDTTNLTKGYLQDVRLHLDTIVDNNLRLQQKDLLEVTDSFMTVPNGLTDILVKYNDKRGYIKPNQTFDIDLYVSERVFNDSDTKRSIELAIKETLDQYLTGNKILKRVVLEDLLLDRVSASVSNLSLIRMTELNADHLEILDDNGEVSISKKLTIIPTGYKVVDDVNFNYYKVNDQGVERRDFINHDNLETRI